MITNIYDLLVQLKENGVSQIESFEKIKHGPTIGTMYEGLTKEILEQSIFKDLNLRVVSGFIEGVDDKLSKQIDCMLVVGEGEKLSKIEEYIYNVKDVIAVIEVKKNLFKKDLVGASENLLSVTKIAKAPESVKSEILRQSFESITGRGFPSNGGVSNFSESEKMIYHSLIVNSYLPTRIIFGYQGLKSEYVLREKFIEHLESGLNKKGVGMTPPSLPNLIICGENTLVKTDGFPYTIHDKDHDDWWICYASYPKQPLLIFLEIIWTKISMYFNLDIRPFLEMTDTMEFPRPLLKAKGNFKGWNYTYDKLSEETLLKYPTSKKWEPLEIDVIESTIMTKLGSRGTIEIDTQFLEYLKSNGKDLDSSLYNLRKERFISVEHGSIQLLASSLLTVMMNDKIFIGDDKDGQMTAWINNLNA